MLCQRCNAQDATHFITKIIDGKATSSQLCADCAELAHPDLKARAVAQMEAGCHYCGAKVGQSICGECSSEVRWFMELKGFTFPKEKPTAEEQRNLAAQWKEVMDHMDGWVAKGKPKRAE